MTLRKSSGTPVAALPLPAAQSRASALFVLVKEKTLELGRTSAHKPAFTSNCKLVLYVTV